METLKQIWEVLNTQLFELGGTSVSVTTLLTVLIIVLVTLRISSLLQRGLKRVLRSRGVEHEGTLGAMSRLLHYSMLLIGFGIALQTIGINLSALFAAGAVFAVGLGFAMQNIAQNFVSGVILLVERAIRPNDILEVEGVVVRVVEMGIRATVVTTRDGEHLIVPNSTLVQSSVKNFTMRDSHYRIRVPVGVTYDSDMKLVIETLQEVVADAPWKDGPQPGQVILTGFGSSSVDFEVSVWVDDPWAGRLMQSKLHQAVWWALKERDVVIAFPQLDVHLDPPVAEGLSQLSRLAS